MLHKHVAEVFTDNVVYKLSSSVTPMVRSRFCFKKKRFNKAALCSLYVESVVLSRTVALR